MIFSNKLIKKNFLISTLILNIKAVTTFNITYPDGTTEKKELLLQEHWLLHWELLSQIGFSDKVIKSGKNYNSGDYEVFINNQRLKDNKTMNYEDNKTYDVKIYKKKDYSIYFSDTEFSDVTNRSIEIKGYNLKIDDILNIIVNYFFYDIDKKDNYDENDTKIIDHYKNIGKTEKNNIRHDLIGNIIYFKHFGGKLFELTNDNTKKEITNVVDDYVLDYKINYLIEFPIGSKVIHFSIGNYGYEDKYGYDFIIPYNKTLKDAFDFFLDLTNLDKNKIDKIRKKKDGKSFEIYVKNDVKEVKILPNSDKFIFDHKGSCIDKWAGRCNRCSDDFKKVKYEDLDKN